MANKDAAIQLVNKNTSENKVFVFSKSWCPYCTNVKKLLKEIEVSFGVLELDNDPNGSTIQDGLKDLTGRSTVPSVWIGGKCVGGCDDVVAAKKSGKLKAILQDAGVSAKL